MYACGTLHALPRGLVITLGDHPIDKPEMEYTFGSEPNWGANDSVTLNPMSSIIVQQRTGHGSSTYSPEPFVRRCHNIDVPPCSKPLYPALHVRGCTQQNNHTYYDALTRLSSVRYVSGNDFVKYNMTTLSLNLTSPYIASKHSLHRSAARSYFTTAKLRTESAVKA